MRKSLIAIYILLALVPQLLSRDIEMNYYEVDKRIDFNPRPKHIIINNKKEYFEHTKHERKYMYANYTIVGIQGMSPGHFVPITKIKLLRNDKAKQITIEITIRGGKTCQMCKVMKPKYKRFFYFSKVQYDFEYIFKYIIIDE